MNFQQAFDKQGFHAGTPPPFNMPLAAGQLATGTQAAPLGTPTGPYGTPYVPLMTHQPHSQMMHHPLPVNYYSLKYCNYDLQFSDILFGTLV